MKSKKPKTWIESKTGRTDRYWLKRIGVLIGKHAYWGEDKVHQEVEILDWFVPLSGEVVKSMEGRINKRADGNIYFSAIMGYILVLWYVRIVRAKCYDPRRPAKLRKRGMLAMANYCGMLAMALMDESKDSQHFPGQKWDPPFAPGAKDGSYV
jgi:hypothetical protein